MNIQTTPITPTELRPDVPSDGPIMSEITEMDFHRFVDSGITVTIKTPFIKTDDTALFTLNLDGYLPTHQLGDLTSNNTSNYYGAMLANSFPVQPFFASRNLVQITYRWPSLPVAMKMNSYRIMAGSVNVGIRVISNVGQTGCFKITQGKGIQRQYYSGDEKWSGIKMQNSGASGDDYMPGGFLVFDVSTNRNVSITTMRNEPTRVTDLMWKMKSVTELPEIPAIGSKNYNAVMGTRNAVTSQFLEDHLFFTPMSDFPATTATQFSMCFFFDYSKVTFAMPFLPMLACPSARGTETIVKIEATLLTGKVKEIKKAKTVYVESSVRTLEQAFGFINLKEATTLNPRLLGNLDSRQVKQAIDKMDEN